MIGATLALVVSRSGRRFPCELTPFTKAELAAHINGKAKQVCAMSCWVQREMDVTPAIIVSPSLALLGRTRLRSKDTPLATFAASVFMTTTPYSTICGRRTKRATSASGEGRCFSIMQTITRWSSTFARITFCARKRTASRKSLWSLKRSWSSRRTRYDDGGKRHVRMYAEGERHRIEHVATATRRPQSTTSTSATERRRRSSRQSWGLCTFPVVAVEALGMMVGHQVLLLRRTGILGPILSVSSSSSSSSSLCLAMGRKG